MVNETELGASQGVPISPLIMNIYFNEFDQKMMEKRIRIKRYADDILFSAEAENRLRNLWRKL